MSSVQQEIEAFVEGWQESPEGNRKGFQLLLEVLLKQEKCTLEFHQRPGITYSLRGTVEGLEKLLFVMVDVIEDEPRWLSVCFYGAMINDPEEKGGFVPGGLLGEDAVCFDLEEYAEQDYAYVTSRIEEAYKSALSA